MKQVPQGFLFAGISAGIKKNKKDIGLIFSQTPAAFAGVTTRNSIFAAPVRYCREIIAVGKAQGILVNSGNANAFTGEQGYRDCLHVTRQLGRHLGIPHDHIAFASTGIIGKPLPVVLIEESFPSLVSALGPQPDDFAEAILTTDLRSKVVTRLIALSNRDVTVTAVAKGSGMIAPSMATMLAFVCTDIACDPASLQEVLSSVVDDTFNMVSVDTDTSTNDMVLAMANGASGVDFNQLQNEEKETFRQAVLEICGELARAIVLDGEGATKLITVRVADAPSREAARRVVKSVADSPLVKTAIHGADPNWGRIAMAVGKVQVPGVSEQTVSISIGDIVLVDRGIVRSFSRDEVRGYLQQNHIAINISLGIGTESATGWGCDLSEDYIRINTAYN